MSKWQKKEFCLNLTWDVTWDHHYSGWGDCLNSLRPHLESLPNLNLVGCLDHAMVNRCYFSSPWVGFLHNVPKHPPQTKEIYSIFDLDLERMIETDSWKKSIFYCKNIFVFSQYIKCFLLEKTDVSITVLKHPTFFPDVKFDINHFMKCKLKQLTLVGHWNRNFQSIFDIDTCYKKNLLVSEQFLNESIHRVYAVNDTVEFFDWLPNDQYDKLLSSSVIFCPLFDCSACNTILDCIARNTPILLPRLPAAEEYLGLDYPLFYDSLEEASSKIDNCENVLKAHRHLFEMNKKDLTFDYFRNSFLRQFKKFYI